MSTRINVSKTVSSLSVRTGGCRVSQ